MFFDRPRMALIPINLTRTTPGSLWVVPRFCCIMAMSFSGYGLIRGFRAAVLEPLFAFAKNGCYGWPTPVLSRTKALRECNIIDLLIEKTIIWVVLTYARPFSGKNNGDRACL